MNTYTIDELENILVGNANILPQLYPESFSVAYSSKNIISEEEQNRATLENLNNNNNQNLNTNQRKKIEFPVQATSLFCSNTVFHPTQRMGFENKKHSFEKQVGFNNVTWKSTFPKCTISMIKEQMEFKGLKKIEDADILLDTYLNFFDVFFFSPIKKQLLTRKIVSSMYSFSMGKEMKLEKIMVNQTPDILTFEEIPFWKQWFDLNDVRERYINSKESSISFRINSIQISENTRASFAVQIYRNGKVTMESVPSSGFDKLNDQLNTTDNYTYFFRQAQSQIYSILKKF